MNFGLLIIPILSFINLRLRRNDASECISMKQTTAINGIFVMLVFMRHFREHIEPNKFDTMYIAFDTFMGQLIVTTFLFYSGYGIMYSIMNKNNYIQTLPKRFLKILLQFDIVVLLYILTGFIIGERPSVPTMLLALISWKSVGNSTWYIFTILCLYIFTFISGMICRKKTIGIIILVTLCCLAYIPMMHLLGKSSYSYNTVICYPLGMLFAVYFKDLISFLKGKKLLPVLALFVSAAVIAICFLITRLTDSFPIQFVFFEVEVVFFLVAIISFTMLFSVVNPVITWLGKHVFEIYVFQRIPMNLFKDVLTNKYLYFVVCLIITIILSILFKKAVHLISVSTDKKNKA